MKNGDTVIGRMMAQTVSSSPSRRSVSTLGTIVTWNGSSISMITAKKIASRPGKRKRESA